MYKSGHSLSLSSFQQIGRREARFEHVFHAIRASAMENICRFCQVANRVARAILRAERHVFFSPSSSLSSCSRCYHCRLFCGFSYYLRISTGLYPPAYNKIPLARLSSFSSFSYFSAIPPSCCNHPLAATRAAFLVCAKG